VCNKWNDGAVTVCNEWNDGAVTVCNEWDDGAVTVCNEWDDGAITVCNEWDDGAVTVCNEWDDGAGMRQSFAPVDPFQWGTTTRGCAKGVRPRQGTHPTECRGQQGACMPQQCRTLLGHACGRMLLGTQACCWGTAGTCMSQRAGPPCMGSAGAAHMGAPTI